MDHSESMMQAFQHHSCCLHAFVQLELPSFHNFPLFTNFQFFQLSSFSNFPVFTTFPFLQLFGFHNFPIFTTSQFLQHSIFYNFPIFTTFKFLQLASFCPGFLYRLYNLSLTCMPHFPARLQFAVIFTKFFRIIWTPLDIYRPSCKTFVNLSFHWVKCHRDSWQLSKIHHPN